MSLNREPWHLAKSVWERHSLSSNSTASSKTAGYKNKNKMIFTLCILWNKSKDWRKISNQIWPCNLKSAPSPSLFLRWKDLPLLVNVCEPFNCHIIFILKSERSGVLRQGSHKHWNAWARSVLRLKFKHFLFGQVVQRVIKLKEV